MSDKRTVEVNMSYQTVVDDLPDAWAFIMDKIESVGPNPSVHIHPATNAPPAMLQALFGSMPESDVIRKFHVSVEGSQMEKREVKQSVVDLPPQRP